jgi:hypothetical protein
MGERVPHGAPLRAGASHGPVTSAVMPPAATTRPVGSPLVGQVSLVDADFSCEAEAKAASASRLVAVSKETSVATEAASTPPERTSNLTRRRPVVIQTRQRALAARPRTTVAEPRRRRPPPPPLQGALSQRELRRTRVYSPSARSTPSPIETRADGTVCEAPRAAVEEPEASAQSTAGTSMVKPLGANGWMVTALFDRPQTRRKPAVHSNLAFVSQPSGPTSC